MKLFKKHKRTHSLQQIDKKTLRISQGDLDLISCLLAFHVFFKLFTFILSHITLYPVDSSLAWLTEVVLQGSGDARLAELSLNEETKTLLELALGHSRGLAGGLWQKMEEYAHSRGQCNLIHTSV